MKTIDRYIKAQEEEHHEEMVRFYTDRTNAHIKRVQENVEKIADALPELEEVVDAAEGHDASKFEEPELTPYISLTWRKKPDHGDKHDEYLLSKEEENEATLHHVKTNPHHPEYWLEDKDEANINAEDRDKSDKVVDATRMSDVAVAEMVADWQAMSDELQKNTAREWFNSQKDVRWHFSPEQEELIDRLLAVFEAPV